MFGSVRQTLIIEGMTCSHCAMHVENALLKLPGVKTAAVDLEMKTATIKVKEPIEKEVLAKAIADAGYQMVEVW